MEKQVTLATEVTYSGIGLHSGKDVTMTLQPGKPGTGIVFTGGTGDFHTESYYPE